MRVRESSTVAGGGGGTPHGPVTQLRSRLALALRERRRHERELRQLRNHLQAEVAGHTTLPAASPDHYRALYYEAPEMFVSVDLASGAITECNKKFAAAVGRPRATLLGRRLGDVAGAGAAGDVDRLMQQLRAGYVVRGMSCRLARLGATQAVTRKPGSFSVT